MSDNLTQQRTLLLAVLTEWQQRAIKQYSKEKLTEYVMRACLTGQRGLMENTLEELATKYVDFVLRDNRGSQLHARTIQGQDLWEFCVADASLRKPDWQP